MGVEKNIRNFKSVKISHDIIHRIDYCYLAEFFRFMGILVCEDILVERIQNGDERTNIERGTDYSANIYVGEKQLGTEDEQALGISADEYRKWIGTFPEQTIYLSSEAIWTMLGYDNKNQDIFTRKLICRLPECKQKVLMERLLSEIMGEAFADVDLGRSVAGRLKNLIDIYVENKIWLHSLNLQYYRKSNLPAKDAKSAFLKCHEEVKNLLELMKGTDVEHWYKYAWLWSEMKVDMACDYEGAVLYFSIDRLSERCEKLIEEYTWFSNAKILLGLCFEPALNRTNRALLAFADALQDIKSECFAAPVFYWMGKRYERYLDNREDAIKCYNLAEKSKSKFRTIFKLAVYARDEGNYKEAIELFNMIIDKLNMKKRLDFTDPLELEYLFKAYAQKSYIYNKNGEDVRAIGAAEKAEEIRNKYIDKNKYFDMLYGDQAETYREILRERLNLDMVEWFINDSGMKCQRY